ncbi:MAG: LysE family translocator [Candidatus Kariarchaeaceae archaeon]
MGINFEDILLLVGLGFTLAAPIGPVNMEMLKQGISGKDHRFFLSLFTGIGAMSGDFIIAMSVLFIGSELLEDLLNNDPLKIALFLLNSFTLFFIGINALFMKFNTYKRQFSLPDSTNHVNEALSDINKQYVKGLVLVLTNPWTFMWWISFGPIILERDITLDTFSERTLVTLMFLVGIFSWVFFISVATRISSSFTSPSIQYNIMRVSGFLIIVFAFTVLIEAICVILSFSYCTRSQTVKLFIGLLLSLTLIIIHRIYQDVRYNADNK